MELTDRCPQAVDLDVSDRAALWAAARQQTEYARQILEAWLRSEDAPPSQLR
jgi:hypothetical protein